MSKILKTKRRFAYIIYNNLKRTSPKEFPTIDEMDVTVSEILPALETDIKGYIEFVDQAKEINQKVSIEELNEEQGTEEMNKLNRESLKFEDAHRLDEVEIEFEKAPFNTFFEQFERWGKEWFGTLDDFVNFRKDINKANQQSGKENKD